MNPRKNTILIMLLGLLLTAFTAGAAQTPAQGDQKKKADACCAMESCCCSGDSCQMMKEDGTTASTAMADTADKKNSKHSCCGDSCKMKSKEMNHADDHGCCSCCGDSCDVNMKQDGTTMKHDATMKHDMKDHKGDCCKAKAKSKKAA